LPTHSPLKRAAVNDGHTQGAAYLKLMNLEFRGKALDVVILRLPSGRVVRRMIFKAAGHS
jgi:hypothetical protein